VEILDVPHTSNGSQLYVKISRPNVEVSCVFIKSVTIENIENETVSGLQNTKINNWPKVSIIIPTRDNLEILKKCCKALMTNTYYPNYEVIIGDSASSDGTSEYIKGLADDRIKCIERKTTKGSYSSINNELVEFSDGELLCFLNDDTEPQPFWLYEMVIKILKDTQIGIVGAKLKYPDGSIQHSGIAFVSQGPANIGCKVLGAFPHNFADFDRYYQAVTGACMLMRREDFEKAGRFDTVYCWCYDDVDLCLRIREKLNKKVLYAANAVLIHHESVTQKKFAEEFGSEVGKGVNVFKTRWMQKVKLDFDIYRKNSKYHIRNADISFITCISDLNQYRDYVLSSLIKDVTAKEIDVIPIFNFGGEYSAAQALNIGIDKSRSDLIVMCHQDVSFIDNWADNLFCRIKEIETQTKKWGVLGTAGIKPVNTHGAETAGLVYQDMQKTVSWGPTRNVNFCPMQTFDEHCMIIRKSSGLKFDEIFNGFHFYGADISLLSLQRGFENFGIICPPIHWANKGLSLSTRRGKEDYKRLLNILANKWGKVGVIRTCSATIINGKGHSSYKPSALE
jgi:GT2 family glycosyltransferase